MESGGEGLADGDTQVLRPLEDLEKFETSQNAGINRSEIRAVVLYTGPIYQVGCEWWWLVPSLPGDKAKGGLPLILEQVLACVASLVS